jgi:hypothetical protein
MLLGTGIVIWVMGLYSLQYSISIAIGIIVFGCVFAIPSLLGMKKTKNGPKLMSAVRIMMSGGNRDFQFDKAGIKSGNVAEFVAKVESTLTAYQKNND